MSGSERRKDARIPVDLDAQVRKGSDLYLAKVLNLSVSGMLLKVPVMFEEGDVISVNFHIPNSQSQVKAQARVMWKSRVENSPAFGVGIQFEQIDMTDFGALGQFIYRALKQTA